LFFDNKKIDRVQINDLVKNNRNNNLIGFIEFNDESCFRNIQAVYKSEINIFDI
jgi:aspartyl/asparaginyl-tRNA synthetase